jgi:hypothetical protein
MSINRMFGKHSTGNKSTPQIEISSTLLGFAPPEVARPDVYLPGQGADWADKLLEIKIPAGRFVAYGDARNGRLDLTASGSDAVLTLHDGWNTKPAGMLANPMSARPGEFTIDGFRQAVNKSWMAGVPYTTAINAAYGHIKTGDRLTGYFGSVTSSTAKAYKHVGKPVLWLAKKTYFAITLSASTIVSLSSAVYPGITPRSVMAWNGTAAVTGAPTLAFDGSTWLATYGSSVDRVMYEFGHDADQIAGEAMRVKNITEILNDQPLFKFVQDFTGSAEFPVAQKKVPVTEVSNETPTTVTSGVQYRVQNLYISVHHPVTVEFKGTLVDNDGVSTTYADWEILPTNLSGRLGNFVGKYHEVNWFTGDIKLAASITQVDAIRISYHYFTDKYEGSVLWGQGIDSLTDGANLTGGTTVSGTTVVPTNPRGVPAELNYSGVIGQLRLWVY